MKWLRNYMSGVCWFFGGMAVRVGLMATGASPLQSWIYGLLILQGMVWL